MIALILLIAAMVGTFIAARRSIATGFGALMVVGYMYGILRANFPGIYTHLLFDAALCGLYAARLFEALPARERQRLDEVRTWLFVLMGWPMLLFLVPTQDILIELVGLRGNIFMLPCLYLGARLGPGGLRQLAWWFAWLNLAAAGLAGVQFVIGIEPFFPRNANTELIYRSGDIANYSAYRIPSSFTSAHAYGGTMLLSLPLLLGAWLDPAARGWRHHLLSAAVIVSILGIFSTGARLPVVQLLFVGAAVVLSGQVRLRHKMRWIVALGIVAWVVSGEARLQRFVTLGDTDFVAERVIGSVNMTFLELAEKYPMGNGLGGGGTSIPYFLQVRIRNSVAMENEYARLLLEQGIPGVVAWMLFLLWLFSRRLDNGSWPQARLITRATAFVAFGAALLGVGLLTSIPGSAILMLTVGWSAVPDPEPDAAHVRATTAVPVLQYGTR